MGGWLLPQVRVVRHIWQPSFGCSRSLARSCVPQEDSYWALHLPHGWWVFGLDNGVENDIDTVQFQYFARVRWPSMPVPPPLLTYTRCYGVQVAREIGPDDRVIFCTHEPDWVNDVFEGVTSAVNLRWVSSWFAARLHAGSHCLLYPRRHLMHKILGDRVALRLAGDLHHYSRYEPPNRVKAEASADTDSPPPCVSRAKSTMDIPDIATSSTPRKASGSKTPSVARKRRRRRKPKPTPADSEYSELAASLGLFDTSANGTSGEAGAGSESGAGAGAGAGNRDPNADATTPSGSTGRGTRLLPALIVSGGGGAFLHPTNLFQGDDLNVGDHKYVALRRATARACSRFPGAQVSTSNDLPECGHQHKIRAAERVWLPSPQLAF